MPKSPLGEFLNVSIGLRESAALPRFDRLELGDVSIPWRVADFALEQGLDYFYSQPGYSFAEDVIQRVELSEQRLDVTYQWHAEITEAIRSTLVSKTDQQRIKVFQEKLVRVVTRGKFRGKVSLVELVKPLFSLARGRSSDGDAAADNRAAILVLAAYVNGRDVSQLTPDVGPLAPAPRITATIQGREDLSQHFFTSAALAVQGGSVLSKSDWSLQGGRRFTWRQRFQFHGPASG